MSRRSESNRSAPPEKPSLGPELVEQKALSYLDRFDGTVAKLHQVLLHFVEREAKRQAVDPSAAREAIQPLLRRFEESGLLSDRRYAESLVESLRKRGASGRMVKCRLRARGVAQEIIDAVVDEESHDRGQDAELQAARALVRRRRLGPYRPSEERARKRRSDLGILARAGFDWETAMRALAVENGSDLEF